MKPHLRNVVDAIKLRNSLSTYGSLPGARGM